MFEVKKSGRFNFVIGFALGAALFGGTVAYAAGIMAQPKTAAVVIDGRTVELQGYIIEGSHYFRLRDLDAALVPGGKDFSIVWDGGGNRVIIDTTRRYDPNEQYIPAVTQAPAAIPAAPAETAPAYRVYVKEADLQYMYTDEYADAVRAEFYRLLNEYRAENGLRELAVNLELQDYADIRAAEQRERSGHTRPDGTPAGSGWHDSRNNLNTRYAENSLATGAIGADPLGTARGIFSIWKDSKGHNAHMLYDFKDEIEMGFGIAPMLDETGFVTSGAVFASGY
jgi:uncharacterized protein YkwD